MVRLDCEENGAQHEAENRLYVQEHGRLLDVMLRQAACALPVSAASIRRPAAPAGRAAGDSE